MIQASKMLGLRLRVNDFLDYVKNVEHGDYCSLFSSVGET